MAIDKIKYCLVYSDKRNGGVLILKFYSLPIQHDEYLTLNLLELAGYCEKNKLDEDGHIFLHDELRWSTLGEIEKLKEYLTLKSVWPRKQENDLPPLPPPHFLPQVIFNQSQKAEGNEAYSKLNEMIFAEKIKSWEKEKELWLKEKNVYLMDQKLTDHKVGKLKNHIHEYEQKLHLLESKEETLSKSLKEREDKKVKDLREKYEAALTKAKSINIKQKDEIKTFEETQDRLKKKLKEVLLELQEKSNLCKKLQQATVKKETPSANKASPSPSSSLSLQLDNAPQKKKEQLSHNEEIEQTRLIGEHFEVSNEEHWMFKKHAETFGAFTFQDMIQKKHSQEISKTTLIKKSGETIWKPLEDTLEFSIPFQHYIEEINGVQYHRYFLKRDSVRVPFYELTTLTLDGKTIKPYCISLSLGGCFLELSRQDIKLITLDMLIEVQFSKLSLDEELTFRGKIVNISEERPRGAGIMFLDVADEAKTVIQNYISHALEVNPQKKSA